MSELDKTVAFRMPSELNDILDDCIQIYGPVRGKSRIITEAIRAYLPRRYPEYFAVEK